MKRRCRAPEHDYELFIDSTSAEDAAVEFASRCWGAWAWEDVSHCWPLTVEVETDGRVETWIVEMGIETWIVKMGAEPVFTSRRVRQ